MKTLILVALLAGLAAYLFVHNPSEKEPYIEYRIGLVEQQSTMLVDGWNASGEHPSAAAKKQFEATFNHDGQANWHFLSMTTTTNYGLFTWFSTAHESPALGILGRYWIL